MSADGWGKQWALGICSGLSEPEKGHSRSLLLLVLHPSWKFRRLPATAVRVALQKPGPSEPHGSPVAGPAGAQHNPRFLSPSQRGHHPQGLGHRQERLTSHNSQKMRLETEVREHSRCWLTSQRAQGSLGLTLQGHSVPSVNMALLPGTRHLQLCLNHRWLAKGGR